MKIQGAVSIALVNLRAPMAIRPAELLRDVILVPVRGAFLAECAGEASFIDATTGLIIDEGRDWGTLTAIGADGSEALAVSIAGGSQRPGAGLLRIDASHNVECMKARANARAGSAARIANAIGLSRTVLAASRRASTRRGKNLSLRVRTLIASDLSHRWTLAQLSCEFGVSSFYLAHAFARDTGYSIGLYQRRLRMAEALWRLAGEEPITQIAFALDYSSHSHFSAVFGTVFGATPSEVRRSLQTISRDRNLPARTAARFAGVQISADAVS